MLKHGYLTYLIWAQIVRQKQCNFEMSERMCTACGVDRCENADLKDITCFEKSVLWLGNSHESAVKKGIGFFFFLWLLSILNSTHRFIDYFRLEGTHKDLRVQQTSCSSQDCLKLTHMTQSIIQMLLELPCRACSRDWAPSQRRTFSYLSHLNFPRHGSTVVHNCCFHPLSVFLSYVGMFFQTSVRLE